MNCLLSFLFCVLFVVFVSSSGEENEFRDWMATHNKVYSTDEEYRLRFKTYHSNVLRIRKLNKVASLGHPSAEHRTKFGLNKFADLSQEEFKNTHMSKIPAYRDPSMPVAPLISEKDVSAIPQQYNWADKGAVTGVKNQGACGSCWSFSTTGNIEGQWFLSNHSLVSLSEQNLVDCDHECGKYRGEDGCDAGCNGGLQPNAFKYVMKMKGIDSEASYPYQGIDGTCHFSSANVAASINNWTMISEDETQMQAWCYTNGPMAIAADAAEWQFYIGGVFYLPCGTSLDHGILITGWGVETDIFDQKMPYWIIKNSWGSDWGESGYLKVERGDGRCGVNLFACSAIIDKK